MFDHNKSEKCQLPFAPFCLPCLYIVHIIMLIYQLISCSHIMFTQRLSKAWVIWGWESMAEQITKKGGKGTINIHKCLCICIYIYVCVCVLHICLQVSYESASPRSVWCTIVPRPPTPLDLPAFGSDSYTACCANVHHPPSPSGCTSHLPDGGRDRSE